MASASDAFEETMLLGGVGSFPKSEKKMAVSQAITDLL